MDRNILSQRRRWFMVLLALFTCVPAFAQYTDRLGGNWNNPASAMITNIIMDRYARRRLEKNLAAKRSGASSTPTPSTSASPTARLNDASVRFRSTGTQLKTREIADQIGAGNPQVLAIMTAILTEYEKNARAAGRPDDLALALSFFFATNASVYHDAGQPTDPQVLELRDTIAEALVGGNALSGMTDRQKQEMYEALVLYSGFALAAYEEGKQSGNAESVRAGQQLAGQNLLAVTGISPDKITFNDQGLSIETGGAAADNSAATPAERADVAPQTGNAGAIDYMELIREYDSNEVAADANYKGKRVRVSGPLRKVTVEDGKALLWFMQTAYSLDLGCFFENSQRASVARLQDQQTFVVECTMLGVVSAGRLMMNQCVLR